MKLEAVSVGDRLDPRTKTLTRPQLFRYSACTWNTHRIHYDPEYATEVEGHADVLVQSHLHGALIQERIMDWIETGGRLRALSWRNVGPAKPEQPITVEAEVVDIDPHTRLVELDAWTETETGAAAEGGATVELPD